MPFHLSNSHRTPPFAPVLFFSFVFGLLCAAPSNAAPLLSSPQHAPDVVVMVHGAGGGGWEYDRWKPIFERAGWTVIAPDLLPAKGGLAKTTFADYAAQVTHWIPKAHRRLVLVGASMGGVLAMKAAETAKPDAIILVNSVAPAGVGKSRSKTVYPAVIRWAHGPVQDTRDSLPDGDEETVQWVAPKWRDESGAVLNAVRKGIVVKHSSVSTLSILGANDHDVPFETGLALAKWVGADVQVYAKTSHIGPLYGRRAAEIAEAAVHWLTLRIAK